MTAHGGSVTVFVLLSGANIKRSKISASESAPSVYKTPFAIPSRNASNILLCSIFNPFSECLNLRIIKLMSLTASGIEVPVGMKNPTSGDYSVMMNARIPTGVCSTRIFFVLMLRTPYAS